MRTAGHHSSPAQRRALCIAAIWLFVVPSLPALGVSVPGCFYADPPYTGNITQYHHERTYRRTAVVPRPLPPSRLGRPLEQGDLLFSGQFHSRLPGTPLGQPAPGFTGPGVVVPDWMAGGAVYGAFSRFAEMGFQGSFGSIRAAPANPSHLLALPEDCTDRTVASAGVGTRLSLRPPGSRIDAAVLLELNIQRVQQVTILEHRIDTTVFKYVDGVQVGQYMEPQKTMKDGYWSADSRGQTAAFVQIGWQALDSLYLAGYCGVEARASSRRYQYQVWDDCDGPDRHCESIRTEYPEPPAEWAATAVSSAGLSASYRLGPVSLSAVVFVPWWGNDALDPEPSVSGAMSFLL